MLTIDTLLEIITTEAIEFSGQQEVPGHKHGAELHFHSDKREGRTPHNGVDAEHSGGSEVGSACFRYDLEVVIDVDKKWQLMD